MSLSVLKASTFCAGKVGVKERVILGVSTILTFFQSVPICCHGSQFEGK